MEKVDRTHWERAELFEFFSAVSHPFYSVTFRVDVANLYRYVKERHLSFYYAMGYLVTRREQREEFPLRHPGRRGVAAG